MSRSQQLFQFGIRTHTVVDLGVVDRPVAVIARELRVGVAILSPCVSRVLRDGRNPKRIDTQAVEKAFFDLGRDAFQVAALVIDTRVYVRTVQRCVVLGIAIEETVHQYTIQHLSVWIVACEFAGIEHGSAIVQRNQQIIQQCLAVAGEDAEVAAPLQFRQFLELDTIGSVLIVYQCLFRKQPVLHKEPET